MSIENKYLTRLFCASVLSFALSGCVNDHIEEAQEPEEVSLDGLSIHPENTEERKIIDEVCSSDGPLFIIDFFSAREPDFGVKQDSHSYDINGDSTNDLAHGDLVAKIAELSGKDVITYGIKLAEGDSLKEFTNNTTIPALLEAADIIRSGEIQKPAAMILSIAQLEDIKMLQQYVPSTITLDADNIGEHKEEIQEGIRAAAMNEMISLSLSFEEGENNSSPESETAARDLDYKMVDIALKLSDTPLITAAGNEFDSEQINMYGIYGAIVVGAETYDGSERTAYTNDNSLTTIYRPGDFIVRSVDGGIDINYDGEADFLNEELSSDISLAKAFGGAPIEMFIFPPQYIDDKEQELAGTAFYHTEDILNYVNRSVPEDKRAKNAIRFNIQASQYGEYVHYQSEMQFRDDGEGNLVFDPANNGDKTQRNIMRGTSFAAPNICR